MKNMLNLKRHPFEIPENLKTYRDTKSVDPSTGKVKFHNITSRITVDEDRYNVYISTTVRDTTAHETVWESHLDLLPGQALELAAMLAKASRCGEFKERQYSEFLACLAALKETA